MTCDSNSTKLALGNSVAYLLVCPSFTTSRLQLANYETLAAEDGGKQDIISKSPDYMLEIHGSIFLSHRQNMLWLATYILKGDTGFRQLLRKRMINSKPSVRSFYCYRLVGLGTGCSGQALIDILAEWASTYDKVQSLLESGPPLKNDELIPNVASADTGNISKI